MLEPNEFRKILTGADGGELALGNLAEQSIDELLGSDTYAASLVRDAEEYAQHCQDCTYRAACNGGFVYDTRATFPYEGSCVTAWHCLEFMVRFIRERGYSEQDIRDLSMSVRQGGASAAQTVSL